MASKYSDELKATVLRQVSVEGLPLKEVAAAAGVAPATLRRWLKAAEPAEPAEPAPVSLVLLDREAIHTKLERILVNEGFQPEVSPLPAHALGHELPAAPWRATAILFRLAAAGVHRLLDLIARSGKDIPIAWLGGPPARLPALGSGIDCEWVPDTAPEVLGHSLERLDERQRLRLQLRDCQRHFEHLQRCCLRAFDNTPNPVAIVRPEGHIYANAAYLALCGRRDFAELRDLAPAALLAPEVGPFLNAAAARLSGSEQQVLNLVLASGQHLRAELERFPGPSNGLQLILRPQRLHAVAENPATPVRPPAAAPAEAPAADTALAEWTARISQALKEDDRFSVVYQPIVSLFGGGAASYEALLRLHDDSGDEILPGAFLPAARQAGLMGVVDQWVIRRAVMQVKAEWTAGRPLRIFINLARESLLGDGFRHWLAKLVDYYQIPATALVFEIPQALLLQHREECRAVIGELRALGCGIVIDDFDAGDAACELLDALAVDGVKFDLARIRPHGETETLQQRIRAIVARLHALGSQVIASRVQDAPSVALLWQCGVDAVQGYFLQQPSQALDYDFVDSECELTERRGQNPFSIG